MDLNAAEESDSGWTTPSCSSSQPGSPRADGTAVTEPAPTALKGQPQGTTAAIAAHGTEGKGKAITTQTTGEASRSSWQTRAADARLAACHFGAPSTACKNCGCHGLCI